MELLRVNEICLITGNHPRHLYFANTIIKTGKVSSWIIEEREEFIPNIPLGLSEELSKVYQYHFSERDRIENTIFGSSTCNTSDVEIYNVDHKTLNSIDTINFVNQQKPLLVLSYGCHKLSSQFIDKVDARFWNTHGGLSPDYRGVITHFWPSYFLEPQMTGVTLHETTDFLDAGDIIFQTAAPMCRGDTLHRLAARNIEVFSKALAEKLIVLDLNNLPRGRSQAKYGRVFMVSDWRPEHLKLIYLEYRDRIVDAVIDGEILGRNPSLISVL